jgi:hypothetical protein
MTYPSKYKKESLNLDVIFIERFKMHILLRLVKFDVEYDDKKRISVNASENI